MKNKISGFWHDFKKFITRGNVLDMAVGVIIGTAFGAIVTAFTNMLLSVATWGVPGGLSGLVTVLPPVNATQSGFANITLSTGATLSSSYTSSDWLSLLSSLPVSEADSIRGLYNSYGGIYYYSGLAIINWGALINAIITFVIIALVLFVIIKVASALQRRTQALAEKLKTDIHHLANGSSDQTADTEAPVAGKDTDTKK